MPSKPNAHSYPDVTRDSQDKPGQAPDKRGTHSPHRYSRYARTDTLSDVNQETIRLGAPTPVRQFTILLSATRRGARLARLLTGEQLRTWGLPFEAPEQIVAELANNAALHGHAPGRSFRLSLTLTETNTLRIEVTDARADRHPPAEPELAAYDAESGRGMLLVAALADRWGTELGPPPCKTVWAEIADAPCPTTRPDRGSHDPVAQRPAGRGIKDVRTEGKNHSNPPQTPRHHPHG